MKKLITILFLLCIGFVSNAQTPDTLQLSAKELFGESDDWNDVGILQSYIDFSKDVLSSLSPNNSLADNCNVSGVCAFETNVIQISDNMIISFFIN